jgi:hypothetical protein
MSSVTAIEEMSEMVASQAGLTEEFQVIVSLSYGTFRCLWQNVVMNCSSLG